MQMPYLCCTTFYAMCLLCHFSCIANILASDMLTAFLCGEVISATGSSSTQTEGHTYLLQINRCLPHSESLCGLLKYLQIGYFIWKYIFLCKFYLKTSKQLLELLLCPLTKIVGKSLRFICGWIMNGVLLYKYAIKEDQTFLAGKCSSTWNHYT